MNGKKIKQMLPAFAIFFVLLLIANVYITDVIGMLLTKEPVRFDLNLFRVFSRVFSREGIKMFFLVIGTEVFIVLSLSLSKTKTYKAELNYIIPDIATPKAAGQNQHGSSRWMKEKEFDTCFNHCILDSNDALIQELIESNYKEGIYKEEYEPPKKINPPKTDTEKEENYFKEGGIVIGKQDLKGGREKIYYIGEDTHLICVGATRSGKSRSVVMESIAMLALAGESIVVTDPKGELRDYTGRMLRNLDYDVYVLDFKNPALSDPYNFLQPIINAVDRGEIEKAIEHTWDITSIMVGESKGEPIWTNGEAATIAGSIMAVVYDNREGENRKYQNLSNVYHFINAMCTPIKGDIIPLTFYQKSLPEGHPAKELFGIANVAPKDTRASFYTSALTTLKLFTSTNIHKMTSRTNIDIAHMDGKKTAVFIVLPEDRITYYSLATLFVNQMYQILSDVADKNGGRLKKRVNFICDEFGNFVKMPAFLSMLTVGGGKGMRFSLFVQDFAQFELKYERTGLTTIKNNCATWLYLKATDDTTLKSLSDRLGNYTTMGTSESMNTGTGNSSGSSSSSMNLIGRPLLYPDEIAKIKRPYSLVISDHDPAILNAPDLSKWCFNRILGMGDKEHNIKLRIKRSKELLRKGQGETGFWVIPEKLVELIQENIEKNQGKTYETKEILERLKKLK